MKLAIIDNDGKTHIVRDSIEDTALARRTTALELVDDIITMLAQLLK